MRLGVRDCYLKLIPPNRRGSSTDIRSQLESVTTDKLKMDGQSTAMQRRLLLREGKKLYWAPVNNEKRRWGRR